MGNFIYNKNKYKLKVGKIMKFKNLLCSLFVISLIILISTSAISTVIEKKEETILSKEQKFIDMPDSKNSIFEINYPRCSNPVIAEKDCNFTIIVESKEIEDIYVYISTAYEKIVDYFYLNISNSDYNNGRYRLTVDSPSNVSEELYNLSVILIDDSEIYKNTEPRSVEVINEFKDDFDFIHITDLHIGDPRGFLESIKETIGYKSVKRCIKEINLLNPDFVVISGDLVFGQLYFKEYSREYEKCYEMIQMFDVPTYLLPGNHDGYRRIGEDGLKFWEEYFGDLYYSFDYGNFHFQAINSYDWPEIYRWSIGPLALTWGGYIQDDQLEWVENDLKNNTDSNLTFMLMHHNPIWDTSKDTLINKGYENREELLDLIESYNVDMVLAGHVHYDDVTIKNDTVFLTTTTPESKIGYSDGYWGYRLIKIDNGSISSYNYKEPKYSIPSYNIDIEYESSTSATITNDLEKDISVLVKFITSKNPYFAVNGTIEKTRENMLFREYYIEVDVPANSSVNTYLDYIR